MLKRNKKKKDKLYTRPLNGAFAWECEWHTNKKRKENAKKN